MKTDEVCDRPPLTPSGRTFPYFLVIADYFSETCTCSFLNYLLMSAKISSFRAFAMNRAADEVAGVARQVVN